MYIGEKKLEDWGIVTSFTIGDAPIRTKKYTVPGRQGAIDASEALTGYPIYDDRTIVINILVHGKTPEEYQVLYDEINRYCHGKTRQIVFPFDSEYYYEGRLKVSIGQSDNSKGTVTITATCYPYALKKNVTYIDASSGSSKGRQIALTTSGMPTKVTVITDAEITITRGGSKKTLSAGNYTLTPLLTEDETITVSGAATVQFSYQEGKL